VDTTSSTAAAAATAVAADRDEPTIELTLSRQRSLRFSEERFEIDQQLELEKVKSRPIPIHKSADGTLIVDWYTTDDAANPQNWSQAKKVFVLTVIW
jgi:MFS transporter, DHA1 family, multidrug resistance protein